MNDSSMDVLVAVLWEVLRAAKPDLLLCDEHDKAVCGAASAIPEDALRKWLTDPFARPSPVYDVAMPRSLELQRGRCSSVTSPVPVVTPFHSAKLFP